MSKVRGIRGATTSDRNTKEAIVEAASEMLSRLIEANDIDPDDVAAALFTTTTDLTAEFPTVAARRMGWTGVALMNSHEMAVPDAQGHCIRVLVLLNTDKSPSELSHVYLKGAVNLRARGVVEDQATP